MNRVDSHIHMDMAAILVSILESTVSEHYSEHLMVWPIIKGSETKVYFVGELAVCIIKNKVQGIPSAGSGEASVKFDDFPYTEYSIEKAKEWFEYFKHKFSLSSLDMAVITPYSTGKTWREYFQRMPQSEYEKVIYQVAFYAGKFAQTIPEGKVVNKIITTGDNNKVLVNSVDNSVNVSIEQLPPVFADLKKATNCIENATERKLIESAINEMEKSYKTDGFINEYNNFMSTAAAHLTVFAPLLPALSQLLVG